MKGFEDIHLSDSNTKNEYVNKFLNGNYNEAFLALINASLDGKMFLAESFNVWKNRITYLENLYWEGVPDYLQTKLNDVQNFIDNLTYKGEFSATETYQIYNLVRYENEIYMYIGDEPSSGSYPTMGGTVNLIIDTFVPSSTGTFGIIVEGGTIDSNGILNTSNLYITSVWLKIGLRGEVGAIGIGTTYQGNWNSTMQYQQYDVVYYQDALWVVKTTNRNVTPVDGTYWEVLFNFHQAYIEDYSLITSPYEGIICFETI